MSKQKNISRFNFDESGATLKNLKISPQKLNLVAGLIRGKTIDIALNNLMMCRKRVAKDVQKLLMSAISNAETNQGLDIDDLIVRQAYVGKGIVMKRFMAKARGRGVRIHKPFSRLDIIVGTNKGII